MNKKLYLVVLILVLYSALTYTYFFILEYPVIVTCEDKIYYEYKSTIDNYNRKTMVTTDGGVWYDYCEIVWKPERVCLEWGCQYTRPHCS